MTSRQFQQIEDNTVNKTKQKKVARVSKDEEALKAAGIGLSIQQIVDLPKDEFNTVLSRHGLTREQLKLCKDVRGRGKNRIAAQNCRRRKIDQVEDLKQRVEASRQRREEYSCRRERTVNEAREAAIQMDATVDRILLQCHLDPQTYTIRWDGAEFVAAKKPLDGQEPPGSVRSGRKEARLSDLPLPLMNPY